MEIIHKYTGDCGYKIGDTFLYTVGGTAILPTAGTAVAAPKPNERHVRSNLCVSK